MLLMNGLWRYLHKVTEGLALLLYSTFASWTTQQIAHKDFVSKITSYMSAWHSPIVFQITYQGTEVELSLTLIPTLLKVSVDKKSCSFGFPHTESL